jgi:3-dehydroquinate dehydratase
MGFYAGDETAGILINSSVYTRSSIAVEDKKNQKTIPQF